MFYRGISIRVAIPGYCKGFFYKGMQGFTGFAGSFKGFTCKDLLKESYSPVRFCETVL